MKNNIVLSKISTFLWLWLPLLLWAGLIFWLSHQPKVVLAPAQPSTLTPTFYQQWSMFWAMPANAELDTVTGKTAHVIVFGILAWLIWRIVPQWKIVLLTTMLYGMLDEFHQLFISGRTGRVLDVFFDCLGALIAVGVLTWYTSRKRVLPTKYKQATESVTIQRPA